MIDKIINWDLDSLPLQNQSQCLHNQVIVEGICGEERGNAQSWYTAWHDKIIKLLKQPGVLQSTRGTLQRTFGNQGIPFCGTGVAFSLWAWEQLPLRQARWLQGFKISQERKQEGPKSGSVNGLHATAKHTLQEIINVITRHAAEHGSNLND